ncbi:hypothetical protein [Vibrio spartinae]|uniref:hypothetical protein n=1 Tax=Vibrio spartinae TaxID=1918945 RepID=UPI0009443AB6|nr:hypothetical protein [Vibrio spartinae]
MILKIKDGTKNEQLIKPMDPLLRPFLFSLFSISLFLLKKKKKRRGRQRGSGKCDLWKKQANTWKKQVNLWKK